MAKSIIQTEKECYLCRIEADKNGYYGGLRQTGLHKHHFIYGRFGAFRKKADRFGLWAYMCAERHHEHGPESPHEKEAAEAYADRSGYIRACEDVKSKIRTEIYKDLEKDKKGTMPGRKKVFICSPYRGDRQGNAERAAGYSRMAYEKGYLPIAPHLLLPQFLDDEKEEERQAGIQMGLDLLLYCDEVWVFGGITEGMLTEIAVAAGHGKRVRAMDPGARGAIERAAGGRQDEET